MAASARAQILTWIAILVVFLGYPLLVGALTLWVQVERGADRAAWAELAELGGRAVAEAPADLPPLETACAGRLSAAHPGAVIGWSAPTGLEAEILPPTAGELGRGYVRTSPDLFTGFVDGRWERLARDEDYYPQSGGLYWKLLFEPGRWSRTIDMATRQPIDREGARWLVASRVLAMTAPQFVGTSTYDGGSARIHAAVLSTDDGSIVCQGLIDTRAPDSVVSTSWLALSAEYLAPDALAAAFERKMRDAPIVAVCGQISDELCQTVTSARF